MKWELLATAPDQLTAEIWCEALKAEGIPAMIEPRDAVSFLGISLLPCRVMVPQDRLVSAREVLQDYTGGEEAFETKYGTE